MKKIKGLAILLFAILLQLCSSGMELLTLVVKASHSKGKNNIGQRDQYYIRDYCPAIISRETYEQANKIMKLRKIGSAENRYEGIFKRMVFCSVCGEPMKRTAYNNGWNCHDHSGRGKNSITDDMIQRGFIACYNRLYLNRENILTPVINLSYEYKEWQNRTNYKLEEIKNRIAQITEQVLIIKKLEAQGCMEPAISMQKSSELNKEISQLKQEKKFLTGRNECDKLIRQTINNKKRQFLLLRLSFLFFCGII